VGEVVFLIGELMPICIICEEEFAEKRYELGYRTCLKCGEKDAKREITRKSKCIAPAYNKG